MDFAVLKRLSQLLAQRNAIDKEIAALTGRPALPGHLGEFIAAEIFGLLLEDSATTQAIDGRFLDGRLAGSSVNVKWYAKHEGILDLPSGELFPDYYLVLAGPKSRLISSLGSTRPLRISSVYLFDSRELIESLRLRGVRIGVATSVTVPVWASAEIFPEQRNQRLRLTDEQRRALSLFA